MELTLLLNKLEDAYKRVQLHPDSTVTAKYFSDHDPDGPIDSLIIPPGLDAIHPPGIKN